MKGRGGEPCPGFETTLNFGNLRFNRLAFFFFLLFFLIENLYHNLPSGSLNSSAYAHIERDRYIDRQKYTNLNI